MKHAYSGILLFAFAALGLNAAAQCSSCTSTITGADASNHIIASGTTLCVSPTGSLSGLVTISAGGTLCNEGTINSAQVWVNGGTLNNYGTMNTHNVLTSNAGTFNNYSTAMIDSLLISQSSSHFNNNGSLSGVRLAVTGGGVATNHGSVHCDYLGDSLGVIDNEMTMVVNHDVYNGYNAVITMSGLGSYMSIGGNFYNSNGATFGVDNCMITVGGDWYNSASIRGASVTGYCGGFNIAGISLNSGTIGVTGEHIDICDAGHPSSGVDVNSGTITSGTTFCSCTNNCMITGVEEIKASDAVQISNVYPNPANTNITVSLQAKAEETVKVEVYNMTGKKVWSNTLRTGTGENKIGLDVSQLAAGTYILSVTDSKQLQAKQLFSVVR